MSLINDALKRASQSEKARPRDPALPSPMQPARETPASIIPIVAGVCVFVLLAAAGWLVWRSISHDVPAPAPIASKPVVPTPVPFPAPAPIPVVVTPPPDTNPPVPVVAPVVAVAPEPPPFPDLKLQGIFYNSKAPKASINGQIRGENEHIGDVNIVKITQTKVTVEWNGQTKDLILVGQ